ncbi:MAG: hypothetical protein ABI724_14480 [Betaproteobacteria bacterium]
MKKVVTIAAAAFGAMASILPSSAAAQISDSWQFEGSIYGYLPTITTKSNLPNGATSELKFDARTILEHLKMTFMGSLEAQKGRWGVFTDVIYMDVGAGAAKTRDFTLGDRVQLPAGVTASTTMDMKTVIWTLGGSYRVVASPEGTLDVLAGARLLDIKINQGFQLTGNVGPIPIPGRSGSAEIKGNNWDAIIGVKGRLALGADGKWFVPYYADVGTGESRVTSQLMGGIGYSFSWGSVIGTWRYLDWDNKSGKPLQNLNINGPVMAVAFRW